MSQAGDKMPLAGRIVPQKYDSCGQGKAAQLALLQKLHKRAQRKKHRHQWVDYH